LIHRQGITELTPQIVLEVHLNLWKEDYCLYIRIIRWLRKYLIIWVYMSLKETDLHLRAFSVADSFDEYACDDYIDNDYAYF